MTRGSSDTRVHSLRVKMLKFILKMISYYMHTSILSFF